MIENPTIVTEAGSEGEAVDVAHSMHLVRQDGGWRFESDAYLDQYVPMIESADLVCRQ